METIDARKLPPKAQEALRFRAVKAVEDGMTHEEAARIFGVARTTVTNWVKLYKKGGNEALRIKKRGRPRGGKLLGWQAAAIVRMITDRCPDQMKFPFALWTREAVARLIKRKYDIELSIWTVGRYLRRWGLVLKSPLEGLTNVILWQLGNGSTASIRQFVTRPEKKRQGSIGVTRWG